MVSEMVQQMSKSLEMGSMVLVAVVSVVSVAE